MAKISHRRQTWHTLFLAGSLLIALPAVGAWPCPRFLVEEINRWFGPKPGPISALPVNSRALSLVAETRLATRLQDAIQSPLNVSEQILVQALNRHPSFVQMEDLTGLTLILGAKVMATEHIYSDVTPVSPDGFPALIKVYHIHQKISFIFLEQIDGKMVVHFIVGLDQLSSQVASVLTSIPGQDSEVWKLDVSGLPLPMTWLEESRLSLVEAYGTRLQQDVTATYAYRRTKAKRAAAFSQP